jgi:hypothetical protein
MQNIRKPKAHVLAADEKTSLVMLYTNNALIRGEVVTKENIRVSIWLRMQGAPEYIHMLKAHLLLFGGGIMKQVTFPEIIIPTSEVLAFHLSPPAQDPMDYDESEANRVMEPITALVGPFRLDGHIRLAAQSDAFTSLTVARNPWFSLYFAEISHLYISGISPIKTPMALVRPSRILFGMNVASPQAEGEQEAHQAG